MEIRIIDNTFNHASSVGNGDLNIKPSFFDWYRGNDYKDISIFTDHNINKIHNVINKSKINIAWLIEPKCLFEQNYKIIKEIENEFDFILTHDISYIDNKKYIYSPLAGSWILPADMKIYNKTKNISIISSNKTLLEGHKLRHEVITKLNKKIDYICGNGYKFIKYKLDALKDFKFSIVIENCKKDYWFTEKLIDCFITGTIPIYWGCPSINNFFDKDGILTFDNIHELENIIENINEFDYYNKLIAINNNFNIAKQYIITEDWIFNNIIKNIKKG